MEQNISGKERRYALWRARERSMPGFNSNDTFAVIEKVPTGREIDVAPIYTSSDWDNIMICLRVHEAIEKGFSPDRKVLYCVVDRNGNLLDPSSQGREAFNPVSAK